MKFLLILIIFFLIYKLVKIYLIEKLFSPPSREEQIKEMKKNEGNIKIYRNNNLAPKPTPKNINDFGKEVEYEEIE